MFLSISALWGRRGGLRKEKREEGEEAKKKWMNEQMKVKADKISPPI
jgi:hypothetical protein